MDTIIQLGQRPSTRSSYRRHSDEFKLAVVTQSLLPNASVARIVREHNINEPGRRLLALELRHADSPGLKTRRFPAV